jgi:hypothetical protein
MSRCDRFEAEAVLLLERGLPLHEHFSACPDCLAAQAFYDRLRQRLAAVGDKGQPPVGWRAGVWERIEQRRGPRRWRPWWGLVPAALAASLAAVLLVRTPEPAPPVFLRAEIVAGPSVQRGDEAKPGDSLRLTASTGGARHAELRVYRNDAELVLRCSTESPCSRKGADLEATVVLDGIGRYQPLFLFSKSPLPQASTQGLDADTEAALTAGAEIELGKEIVVR